MDTSWKSPLRSKQHRAYKKPKGLQVARRGSMAGFERSVVDDAFFPDGRFVSQYLVNIGYADNADVSRDCRASARAMSRNTSRVDAW